MTPHPANEGLCQILDLHETFEPALMEIHTSLCEKFPVFDPRVLDQAVEAQRRGLHVHLQIETSHRGTHYVKRIHPIDFAERKQPCWKCTEWAVRIDVGDGAPYFSCPWCRTRMYRTVPAFKSLDRTTQIR